MRRVDRLILGEMLGPWLFGVAIFTVLIMAGTYLFKITDYIVKGISMATIAELTVLLLPGIMAKTFPMAVLLATLLSFGRLSSDSEVVALRAAGTSLVRVMAPVAAFGFGVSLLAFLFNETLVPGAALRATTLQNEIAAKISGSAMRPTSYFVYDRGSLVASVVARDFDFGTRTLEGASVVTYEKDGAPGFVLLANRLEYQSDQEWRLRGGGTLLSTDGRTMVRLIGEAWPEQVPKPKFTPTDILSANLKDLDSLSLKQMRNQIDRARANPKVSRGQVANLEYGYWNKLALPLAALVYALVGAPLGIRNHRTGAAAGFWLSVIIIFGYMMLANFMAIYAQGGVVPAWVASFLPLVVGLVVAAVAIVRKDS